MVDFLLYVFDGDVGLMVLGVVGIVMAAVFMTRRLWGDWAIGKLVEFEKRRGEKKKMNIHGF